MDKSDCALAMIVKQRRRAGEIARMDLVGESCYELSMFPWRAFTLTDHDVNIQGASTTVTAFLSMT